MNITWIIGNGFDIRCGLETTYKHFYDWIEKTGKIDSDNDIYRTIKEKRIDWSYFEKKLGEYSKELSDDKIDLFENNLEILISDLVEYLYSEENRIEETKLGNLDSFFASITSFPKYLRNADCQALEIKKNFHKGERSYNTGVFEGNMIPVNVSYISFNYTNTFQKYWNTLKPSSVPINNDIKLNFNYRFGDGCNLHNTLQTGMVLGCDNVNQCNPMAENLLVKPVINENTGELNDDMAMEMIEETDIFILFGTSIGETDKTWWREIADRCLDPKCRIIIFNYNETFNKSNTLQTIRTKNSFIEHFLSHLDHLDQDSINSIRLRTIVSEDIADMFQMKPTLKWRNSSPEPTGQADFIYSSNNGKYRIGSGDMAFELHFTKASNTSIHMTRNSKGIESIALAKGISEINQIKNIDEFDFTSRVRTPQIGNIVIIKNTAGYYAAVKLIDVTDNTKGDEVDEVEFEYVILNNKSYDFSTNNN